MSDELTMDDAIDFAQFFNRIVVQMTYFQAMYGVSANRIILGEEIYKKLCGTSPPVSEAKKVFVNLGGDGAKTRRETLLGISVVVDHGEYRQNAVEVGYRAF